MRAPAHTPRNILGEIKYSFWDLGICSVICSHYLNVNINVHKS